MNVHPFHGLCLKSRANRLTVYASNLKPCKPFSLGCYCKGTATLYTCQYLFTASFSRKSIKTYNFHTFGPLHLKSVRKIKQKISNCKNFLTKCLHSFNLLIYSTLAIRAHIPYISKKASSGHQRQQLTKCQVN